MLSHSPNHMTLRLPTDDDDGDNHTAVCLLVFISDYFKDITRPRLSNGYPIFVMTKVRKVDG